ncbi:MAG: helix-turn-helix domain-containing protein, partial [Rickettsiales bacterium]|nr:helix-turn-helix domain-containing protein [Rickettsiales bacterium]
MAANAKQQVNIIGQRLKSEMKRRGVTSARLAETAGVKTSFIYDIISGKSANPSTLKLARVADSLGISLKSLVDNGEFAIQNSPDTLSPGRDFVLVPRLAVDTTQPHPAVISTHQ